MENDSLLVQSDLKETTVAIDGKDVSSTIQLEDNQLMVDIKKNITAVEILEETSFVVEESGVIHVKTKRIFKNENTSMVEDHLVKERMDGEVTAEKKTSVVDDAQAPQDSKKEDVALQNSETSMADIYLQLDVTDNLDVYLERERVRKLKLSKANNKADNEVALNKDDTTNKEKSSNEDECDICLNKKRPKLDNGEKDEISNLDEINVSLDQTNTTEKSIDTEVMNVDSSKSNNTSCTIKPEQASLDKKDCGRFIWVSNVSNGTKATDLKMHLATHGKVQLAKIVTDGKECFGYVVMESHEDVVNCMENLQNSLFENKEILLSDKMPERKRHEKPKDQTKEKENRKSNKKKKDSLGSSRKETKSVKSDHRNSPDPLTLKVSDSKQKEYIEERQKVETLERKRFLRERDSMERREVERKRREMERERERERQRERELRRRERIEAERQKQVQLKLEKERRKLEYERKMIEKQKMELLRYKRKLFTKEKEDSRAENKKRRNQDDFDRKKYTRIEEHVPKHSSMEIAAEYWKTEKVKSPPHEVYKKNTQDLCVAPPPPILSSNYHPPAERPRSSDRDRQWYDRKEYEHRIKPYGRKTEENRNYGITNDSRQPYQEKPFPKDQFKHKDYNLIQTHNSWDGFATTTYKDQNIPILRNEPLPRSMQRHPGYQEGPYGPSPQDYYPGSSYRRVDYYNRPVDRKY